MGWTRSWKRKTELPSKQFAAAVEDGIKIVQRLGISLGGFDGTGAPIFQDDVIVINGAAGLNCEPFEIHQIEFNRQGRDEFWSFCKTEGLPYDFCVQTILIVLKHHLGDLIQIGSDGTDENWSRARSACQDYLGYGRDFRLENEIA